MRSPNAASLLTAPAHRSKEGLGEGRASATTGEGLAVGPGLAIEAEQAAAMTTAPTMRAVSLLVGDKIPPSLRPAYR